ncbi:MAG TPA: hypothetical protein VK338_02920, partial [Candidatus Nitrosocosmicus sp.]|nr:hypothetical protein [Candidatus Nitrosocosmicus sp.]
VALNSFSLSGGVFLSFQLIKCCHASVSHSLSGNRFSSLPATDAAFSFLLPSPTPFSTSLSQLLADLRY